MPKLTTALLAGVAAFAIGASGALAQSSNAHVMTVRLPQGGVAQIEYTGNVPPRVTVSDVPAPLDVFAPPPALFGPESPFAMMQRISAEMDREAAAMFRPAAALTAAARSGQAIPVAFANLPPGAQEYSIVSTMSGNGVCTQSVEITAQGNGAPPRVVSHSSGNCGAQAGPGGAVNLPTATPPAAQPAPVWTSAPLPLRQGPAAEPHLLYTGAPGTRHYAGLVREIPPAQ